MTFHFLPPILTILNILPFGLVVSYLLIIKNINPIKPFNQILPNQ